jgi:hypothetical protein
LQSEHILLESDEQPVPDRGSARKVQAHHQFRSRLRRRTVTLDLFDEHFLHVRIERSGAVLRDYVLDLRFIDPELGQARHVAWRWIAATLCMVALVLGTGWWMASSRVPWWQPVWLAVCGGMVVLTAAAAVVSAFRTTETLTLRSVHGRARLFECIGGPGRLHAMHPFITRLTAHIQTSETVRQSVKSQHLRDEMREHFRLKEAGVLGEAEYEQSKVRILSAHG